MQVRSGTLIVQPFSNRALAAVFRRDVVTSVLLGLCGLGAYFGAKWVFAITKEEKELIGKHRILPWLVPVLIGDV